MACGGGRALGPESDTRPTSQQSAGLIEEGKAAFLVTSRFDLLTHPRLSATIVA
jgi:hypothetical protein